MITGALLSGFFARFSPVTPYLIFVMLFVTFCRIDLSKMKPSPLHFWLLACQVLGCVGVYFLLRMYDETFAQGVMICVMAPMATSAVVIAGMLGANIATVATFALMTNIAVAVFAPVIFSLVGTNADMDFMDSFLIIFKKVVPILVLPFVCAVTLRRVARKAYDTVGKYQIITFYIWAFALMVVSGQTVEFVKAQEEANYRAELWIALGALVACLCQFLGGWAIGKRYGDRVAGGQSLGQKNTVLAIWMAQTYLNPIASIGPASYVLWQNIVNSWQIWRNRKLS